MNIAKFFRPSLLLALCLLLHSAALASAEKADWVDKDYDFSRIKSAIVCDIELKDKSEFESDLLELTLQEDYQKNAQRPKYKYLTAEKAKVLSPDNPKEAADVYIRAELLKWHDDAYIKPGYTSWERQTAYRTKTVNGQKGIFGRICKSFFDDLNKKLSK